MKTILSSIQLKIVSIIVRRELLITALIWYKISSFIFFILVQERDYIVAWTIYSHCKVLQLLILRHPLSHVCSRSLDRRYRRRDWVINDPNVQDGSRASRAGFGLGYRQFVWHSILRPHARCHVSCTRSATHLSSPPAYPFGRDYDNLPCRCHAFKIHLTALFISLILVYSEIYSINRIIHIWAFIWWSIIINKRRQS